MTLKTVVNSIGEMQDAIAEVRLQGGGGELGEHAVTRLAAMIGRMKDMKTEEKLRNYSSTITGYSLCCRDCGFLTEKSLEELAELIAYITERECRKLREEKAK